MRHAAHKAAKVSHAQFSLSKALFTANRGSHTAKAVRMAQLAEGGAVVGLAPEVVDKLNEVAPMSRRAMREAAKAASRKSALVTSASLRTTVPKRPRSNVCPMERHPVPKDVPPLRNWLPPATTAVGSWETPAPSWTPA